ncbi:hypothetical protein CTZ27_04630 [Streptomyces griseocarneus]|nr:hypothetical protein CTZ27_04630 [Streptomyces griseocarneus]
MPGGTPHRPRGTARTVQTRLPWWGVALPAVAFALLLFLLAGPAASASPESGSTLGAAGALARLVAFVQYALGG